MDHRHGELLQRTATARADELPDSELTHPFGAEWDVFKVRGKVFMLQTDREGEKIVTVKAHPSDSEALRAQYDDIRPGYHMNKRHWITLHPGGGLEAQLVRELVTDSYLLVVANLPRRLRPVDPEIFGAD